MSKDLPQPKPSEEVDLGQLFKLIGNAFDRFFRFVTNIFKGLYKVVLLLLIHFYKRVFWYVGTVIIGLMIGYFVDKNSEKLYGANLFIETNFDSARQVYQNMNQFHQMAKVDKDSSELSKRLGITPYEASKIRGFYIEPDLDENDIAERYSEFYKKLDSVSRVEMNYDRYKKSLTSYDYKIHRIGVASTDKSIYKKIEKAFIDQLSDNPYLDELVESNTSILKKKDKTLVTQIEKTDSLVTEYLKIRINESKKETTTASSGTNVFMGDSESSSLIVDESKILKQRLEYEDQRRAIDSALVTKKTVINVLADFPKSGYDISNWTDKMKIVIPLSLFIITLFGFVLIGLGKYVSNESKKTEN